MGGEFVVVSGRGVLVVKSSSDVDGGSELDVEGG